MRISTTIHDVVALTAEARHINGTLGPFSLLELTFTDKAGNEVRYDLILGEKGDVGRQVADAYSRAINTACIETLRANATPVETVEEVA